jgi:pilus assembly protein CpaF
VNVVVAPLALDGSIVTIRRFRRRGFGPDELVANGTWAAPLRDLLAGAVTARCNVLISGGTGSGKTTTLNALTEFIGDSERIVTVEDAAELRLRHAHVVRLEARPASLEGRGEVTVRRLVRNALRMRPDRIVVGEVRGGEALDMLQAMNTGHDGAMSTIHANSPRDALSRLETLVLMAGLDLPVRAIRQQVRGAINLVVHVGRLSDGRRKVLSIAELTGFDDHTIGMQELFVSEASSGAAPGRTRLMPTGIRPQIMDRIYQLGVAAPELGRLYPKNPAGVAVSGRRVAAAPENQGGVPARDRRQS